MDPKVYSPLTKEYNLHRSPLEQVYDKYSELHHSKHEVLLTCNYQIRGEIFKLPFLIIFYQNKLTSCDTILKYLDYKPLMFLKLDGQEIYLPEFESYLNVNEADKIIRCLKEMLLPKWPVAEWAHLFNSVGILTTEYAQVCVNQFS